MTTDEAVAAVDLEYGLAIDVNGTSRDGVYVYPLPTGARILVDEDSGNSASKQMGAAECVRLGVYLLACAKAAVPDVGPDSASFQEYLAERKAAES